MSSSDSSDSSFFSSSFFSSVSVKENVNFDFKYQAFLCLLSTEPGGEEWDLQPFPGTHQVMAITFKL